MSRARRGIYRALGGGAMALALLGVATPLLPTTPFLLVAAWAFARGAPEWRAKLDRHPRFGPILQQWESRRAIPAKAAAVAGLSASWGLIVLTTQTAIIPAATAIIMGSVGVYVVSRPTQRRRTIDKISF